MATCPARGGSHRGGSVRVLPRTLRRRRRGEVPAQQAPGLVTQIRQWQEVTDVRGERCFLSSASGRGSHRAALAAATGINVIATILVVVTALFTALLLVRLTRRGLRGSVPLRLHARRRPWTAGGGSCSPSSCSSAPRSSSASMTFVDAFESPGRARGPTAATGRCPGPARASAPPAAASGPLVALTFDDGPTPRTDRVRAGRAAGEGRHGDVLPAGRSRGALSRPRLADQRRGTRDRQPLLQPPLLPRADAAAGGGGDRADEPGPQGDHSARRRRCSATPSASRPRRRTRCSAGAALERYPVALGVQPRGRLRVPGRGEAGALPRGRGRRPGGYPSARRRRHLRLPDGAVGLPAAGDRRPPAKGFEFGVVELADQAVRDQPGVADPVVRRWDRPHGSGRAGRCSETWLSTGPGQGELWPSTLAIALLGRWHVLLAYGRRPAAARSRPPARRQRAGSSGPPYRWRAGARRGAAPSRPRTCRPIATSARQESRTACSPWPTSPRTTGRRRSYLDAARQAARLPRRRPGGRAGALAGLPRPGEMADDGLHLLRRRLGGHRGPAVADVGAHRRTSATATRRSPASTE